MSQKDQREAFLILQAWEGMGSMCKALMECGREDLVKKLHGLEIDFIQLASDARSKLSSQEKAELDGAQIRLLGKIQRNPFSEPGQIP